MILGFATRASDWLPFDGWPMLDNANLALGSEGIIDGLAERAAAEHCATEMARWPECKACGLEECEMDGCLDCGAEWCRVGGFHACPGRPGENEW